MVSCFSSSYLPLCLAHARKKLMSKMSILSIIFLSRLNLNSFYCFSNLLDNSLAKVIRKILRQLKLRQSFSGAGGLSYNKKHTGARSSERKLTSYLAQQEGDKQGEAYRQTFTPFRMLGLVMSDHLQFLNLA